MIYKVGGPLIIGISLLLILIVLALLTKYNKKLNKKANDLVEKAKKKLIWNAFIRYTLQSYL